MRVCFILYIISFMDVIARVSMPQIIRYMKMVINRLVFHNGSTYFISSQRFRMNIPSLYGAYLQTNSWFRCQKYIGMFVLSYEYVQSILDELGKEKIPKYMKNYNY